MQEHLDRASLSLPQLLGVGISAGGEGPEPSEEAGGFLEKEQAGTGHLEREEGTRAPEVDKVQPIAAEPGRQDKVEGIEVCRTFAENGKVEIALRPGPALRGGAEQDEQLEIWHRFRHAFKTLAKRLRGKDHAHTATLAAGSSPVKEPQEPRSPLEKSATG